MLVLRPRPSASRSSPEPAVSGSRSSLERNPGASMGWKKRDPDHCIGLGIVAALEKSPPAATQMVVLSAPIAISSHIGRRCPHGTDKKLDTGGFFSVSPPACEDEPPAGFRVADFLSHCNLCRKRLHGEDIYMYRGEKAFCSMECRYQQIVSDEYKEKCWSTGASAAADAASPYAGGGRLFLIPGIAAA